MSVCVCVRFLSVCACLLSGCLCVCLLCDKAACVESNRMAASPVAAAPVRLTSWLETNAHLLKPPVCNKLVYGGEGVTCGPKEPGSWQCMVVGGPNSRSDYHLEEGEEFFFQLSGQLVLKVMERGSPRDIVVNAGEVFLLPARVPHSPNRMEKSVGLVLERQRREGERDALSWFDGSDLLYQEVRALSMVDEYAHEL